MHDETGAPTQLPPRWYTVHVAQRAEGEMPDWKTVQYHRYLSEAKRRLGINLHHPRHPDLESTS
jgi:hypothetical protein